MKDTPPSSQIHLSPPTGRFSNPHGFHPSWARLRSPGDVFVLASLVQVSPHDSPPCGKGSFRKIPTCRAPCLQVENFFLGRCIWQSDRKLQLFPWESLRPPIIFHRLSLRPVSVSFLFTSKRGTICSIIQRLVTYPTRYPLI